MTTFRSELCRVFFTAVVAVLVLGSCNESSPPPQPRARQVAVANDSGVMEFRVSQPATMYGLVRQALFAKTSRAGGKAPPLPQSLPLLVVSVLGLPPLAAGRLAEQGDWLGYVSRTPRGEAAWALAVPLQSGSEFVAELTLGAGAPRKSAARGGWTQLEGANVGVLGSFCVGVVSNMLLFGASCREVELLAIRLTLNQSIAPAPLGTGVAVRLLTSGSVLQGLYAEWGSKLRQFLDAVLPSQGPETTAIGEMLALLDARVSAYLGHIESGDVLFEVQGPRIVVAGKFGAPALPVPVPSRSLCEAVARIPTDTPAWVAGAGYQVQVTGLPDWHTQPGEWERSIETALAFTLGTPTRPALSTLAPSAFGQWVVGIREGAAGRTFWSMLERGTEARALELLAGASAPKGVTPTSQHVTGGESALDAKVIGATTTGRVVREGKALEWGVTPWASGVAIAVGASLGEEWQAWSRRLRGTAPEFQFRSSSCHGVVAGMAVGSFVELVVVRAPEGLELRGILDVTGQWSTKR